jgi:hypothetical protein
MGDRYSGFFVNNEDEAVSERRRQYNPRNQRWNPQQRLCDNNWVGACSNPTPVGYPESIKQRVLCWFCKGIEERENQQIEEALLLMEKKRQEDRESGICRFCERPFDTPEGSE